MTKPKTKPIGSIASARSTRTVLRLGHEKKNGPSSRPNLSALVYQTPKLSGSKQCHGDSQIGDKPRQGSVRVRLP